MPDRERDLERELRDLGPRLEYPRTPDLAGATRRRIEEEERVRVNRRLTWWLPALSPRWAVAAMFVIVLALPLLFPTIRQDLSSVFARGGASYSGGAARPSAEDQALSGKTAAQGTTANAAAPGSASGAQAAPESSGPTRKSEPMQGRGNVGAGKVYVTRIPLQEARSRAGNAPVLLAHTPGLGKPDAVYEVRAPYGTRLALVYDARAGLPALGGSNAGMVLTESQGDLQSTYLRSNAEKRLLEETEVGNRRGYWNSSSRVNWLPGSNSGASSRPMGSVLLWEQDGVSLRLESNLGKNEAIGIAESVR